MKKKIVFGFSILCVVVIILASISNVVGYQTVQATNQEKINKEVNQREFIFQTIYWTKVRYNQSRVTACDYSCNDCDERDSQYIWTY